ncbi:hypothetical protein O1L55_00275 [Streptomyces albulus]|nr:hypothetical protein [Streptomyces noursei]
MVAWSAAAALATIGNNVGAAYFIQIGSASGFSAATAGTLQMVASVLGIAVRLASGGLADRAPHRIPRTVAVMMLTGTVGLAVIVVGTPVAFVAGALLAVAGGWGWTGLLLAATMRLLPGERPGRGGDAGRAVRGRGRRPAVVRGALRSARHPDDGRHRRRRPAAGRAAAGRRHPGPGEDGAGRAAPAAPPASAAVRADEAR